MLFFVGVPKEKEEDTANKNTEGETSVCESSSFRISDIRDYLRDLITQVEKNITCSPIFIPTKVYNLRSRKIVTEGVIDVEESSKQAIKNYRIIFTYKSPYFPGSIDITEYDRVCCSSTCQIESTESRQYGERQSYQLLLGVFIHELYRKGKEGGFHTSRVSRSFLRDVHILLFACFALCKRMWFVNVINIEKDTRRKKETDQDIQHF